MRPRKLLQCISFQNMGHHHNITGVFYLSIFIDPKLSIVSQVIELERSEWHSNLEIKGPLLHLRRSIFTSYKKY